MGDIHQPITENQVQPILSQAEPLTKRHGRVQGRPKSGIAIGSGLAFRDRYVAAVCVAALFFSIPLLVGLPIPWQIFGPMVLIGLGVVVPVKAFHPCTATAVGQTSRLSCGVLSGIEGAAQHLTVNRHHLAAAPS